MADQMRRWTIKPKNDLRELYKRIIFNAFISNEDDHPRNHGFVYATKGGYRLSPAYDLMPKSAIDATRYSAMTLGIDGRVFTKDNILSKCEAFDLKNQEAKAIFDEIKKKASGWRRFYKEINLTDNDFVYLEAAFN